MAFTNESKEQMQIKDALNSSDSDEDGRLNNRSGSMKTHHRSAKGEYPPLTNLKKCVKGRILELAQLNSEQTVQLVETFLNDEDF